MVDLNAMRATVCTVEAPLACGLVLRATLVRDESGTPVQVDISRTSAGAPVYPLAPHNVPLDPKDVAALSDIVGWLRSQTEAACS